MAPVGAYIREKGEHVIVHACRECGRERHNRIAADDDFLLVLQLPPAEPRVTHRKPRRALDRSA